MARRKTNAAKRAERKRETNAQRREREDRHLSIVHMAEEIELVIYTVKRYGCLPDTPRQAFERAKGRLDSAPRTPWFTTALNVKWVQSESIENIASALRLAADILEKKPQDGRAFIDQDKKIRDAFFEVIARASRAWRDRSLERRLSYQDYADQAHHLLSTTYPTFSEFLQVYRERDPGDRSEARKLRRSLQRLGLRTRPDKQGRPKGKGDPKTP